MNEYRHTDNQILNISKQDAVDTGKDCFSPVAGTPCIQLLNLHQRLIRIHCVAFGDIDRFDGAGNRRLNLRFHFHHKRHKRGQTLRFPRISADAVNRIRCLPSKFCYRFGYLHRQSTSCVECYVQHASAEREH